MVISLSSVVKNVSSCLHLICILHVNYYFIFQNGLEKIWFRFNVVPSKEPTELFFIIPVTASLKRILEENWTSIENYKSDHTHDDGRYRDICCGELYQQQNGCDDPTKLLSLLFHIDSAVHLL